METKTYTVKDGDTHWVAGKRVREDRTVELTDAAAAADLARGNIELAGDKSAEAQPEAASEGGSTKKKRGED